MSTHVKTTTRALGLAVATAVAVGGLSVVNPNETFVPAAHAGIEDADGVPIPGMGFRYLTSRIDGDIWKKDNPRLFTVRQATEKSKTENSVTGTLLNNIRGGGGVQARWTGTQHA